MSQLGADIFISQSIKTSKVYRPQPCLHLPLYTVDLEPHRAVTAQTIGRWIKIVL
ncbi:unnamed protein product, partial [Allacma fusca]